MIRPLRPGWPVHDQTINPKTLIHLHIKNTQMQVYHYYVIIFFSRWAATLNKSLRSLKRSGKWKKTNIFECISLKFSLEIIITSFHLKLMNIKVLKVLAPWICPMSWVEYIPNFIFFLIWIFRTSSYFGFDSCPKTCRRWYNIWTILLKKKKGT